MSAPPPNQPRTSTSRSNRDDVLQFLDSLDAYSGTPTGSTTSSTPSSTLPRSTSNSTLTSSHNNNLNSTSGQQPKSQAEAQSVLDFLDEITATKTSTTTSSSPLPPRSSLDKKQPLGRSTSRQNISAVANGATTGGGGGSPVGSGARRSTDSVRSQRSLGTGNPSSTLASGGSTTTTQQQQQQRIPSTTVREGAGNTSGRTSSPAPPPPTTTSSIAPSSTAPPPPSQQQQVPEPQQPAQGGGGGGGWGWSSVWTTASSALNQASQIAQQARTVAEEQVKTHVPSAPSISMVGGGEGLGGMMKKAWEGNGGEQAKKWSEGVISGLTRGTNLEGLGKELKSTTLKSLTDLLNAVAPPIAEHEVIQVSLSHDMVGYDGVETLVYRGLAKIMDQIEGGTLIVNKGIEDRASTNTEKVDAGQQEGEGGEEEEDERNLNLVHGFESGWKLAQERLDRLIKNTYKPPVAPVANADGGVTVPVTTCPVYLRIQPCLASLPSLQTSSTSTTEEKKKQPQQQHLFFLLLLIDPTHNLTHETLSQSLPAEWLDVPFEENEWVEDQMVEVIRRAVEVVGQEYIMGRMRAQTNAISQVRSEAIKTLEEQQQQQVEGGQEQVRREGEEEISTAAQEARVGIV